MYSPVVTIQCCFCKPQMYYICTYLMHHIYISTIHTWQDIQTFSCQVTNMFCAHAVTRTVQLYIWHVWHRHMWINQWFAATLTTNILFMRLCCVTTWTVQTKRQHQHLWLWFEFAVYVLFFRAEHGSISPRATVPRGSSPSLDQQTPSSRLSPWLPTNSRRYD